MLPAAIEYLLTLREYGGVPGVYNRIYQVIIPNFPPSTSISYTISPTENVYAYILYEWAFGQAMVPHAFDVKIHQAGNKLFDAIISGRFTTDSLYTFACVTAAHPVDVAVTNLRLLVNYYELTTFYVTIPNEDSYKIMVAALKRMYTSTKMEHVAELLENLLAGQPTRETPRPGGRR